MSSSITPGLQVRSRRVPPRLLRPSTPSGPGVRWRLSRDFAVRFNADMTRIHRDAKGHRNLVQLRYRTSRRERPSDVVLALLLQPFTASSPTKPIAGNRCWILEQNERGWTLALDVRNGRGCCFVLPGATDQGQPLGVPLDQPNLRGIAETARTLWQAADHVVANPTGPVPEVMLRRLSSLMAR